MKSLSKILDKIKPISPDIVSILNFYLKLFSDNNVLFYRFLPKLLSLILARESKEYKLMTCVKFFWRFPTLSLLITICRDYDSNSLKTSRGNLFCLWNGILLPFHRSFINKRKILCGNGFWRIPWWGLISTQFVSDQ